MSRTLGIATIGLLLVVALQWRSGDLHAATSTQLPNGWKVTPAGAVTNLGTLPLHMVSDPSGRWIAEVNDGYSPPSVSIIDTNSGQVVSDTQLGQSFYGVTFSPDGRTLYLSTANGDSVRRYALDPRSGALGDAGAVSLGAGRLWLSGLAVSADGHTLYAVANGANSVIAFDPDSGVNRWAATVGKQPYTVVSSKDGRQLYVSNWAGASVSVLDAASGRNLKEISSCSHPNAELLSDDGKTLYVACANDDRVAFINTADYSVRATLDTGLFSAAPPGAIPNGLSLSADGKTLFIADAGENAIVAADVSSSRPSVYGAVPTGWYPTDVFATRDGSKLFVLDGKGVAGHANPGFPHIDALPHGQHASDDLYVASLTKGDIEMLALPDRAGLIAGLGNARLNSAFSPAALQQSAPASVLSTKLHVIYVIKENRTYDEVLGDDSRGNGQASLTIFGRNITPNIHRLVRDFVLLDNFDTDAQVSADGHNWSTAAYCTDYVEKTWPPDYGDRGRQYDFEEDGPATPPGGYLWDDARKAGISVRDYGEFVTKATDNTFKPTAAGLNGIVDPLYHGFDVHYSDQDRITEWLREFRQYATNGNLPRLEIVRLPDDHTAATRPGAKTPYAMVADNDYALGRLVDAVSHSRYWGSTIIFSVEDDAQAGPDHVSDHRAETLVVGGPIRRGYVDHTHYTTSSVLRTIELVLGMPPMSQFDAGATPMLSLISPVIDSRPWSATKPLVNLNAVNPGTETDAHTSQLLNFEVADAADPATVNAILYRFARQHPLRRATSEK